MGTETLQAPAVRVQLPDGQRIFEGVTHFDAAVAAVACWANTTEEQAYDAYLSRIDNSLEKALSMEDGFTLTSGEFVSREKAAEIARQQSPGVAHAMEKENREWLDSLDLDLIPT